MHPAKSTQALESFTDITDRKRAEEALRESEDRYRNLVENSIDAVLLTDPDGSIYAANAEARRIFGMTEEELIRAGRNGVADLSDPRLKPALEERARTGRFKGELRLRRKDGTTFPGEVSSALFTDREGVVRTTMIVRDITERKQAEEALRQSEERFRLLTENASDIVVVLDPGGRIQYASPSVKPIGGYAPEDLIGRSVLELTHPDDLQLVVDALRTAAAHPRERITLEVRIRHISGEWLYLDIIGANLLEEPAVRGFLVNARDITDRKRAEEALKESEERFRLAIEDAPIPIIMHAEDGEVLQISRTWTELTGYTLEDVPTFDAWLTRAYGEGADAVRDHVQALFRGDRHTIGIEFPIHTRDGLTRHWSFFASSPGTLTDGRRFIVGMVMDITERKRAEEALRRRTEDLVRKSGEVEAARDEANMYLDIMTHDVRNANNVSSMYADLLADLAEGDLKTYAEKLHDSIDRSSEILRNVATIRRASEESGNLVPVNLDAVIRDEIARFPGASIRYDGSPVEVLADGLLPTVFTNLIGNAVKFGGADVEIAIRAEERNGEVLVSVEDTGPGVPDEVKGKLFTRFERGMARGSGQGLGLFIVRTLVERYGGRVRIDDRAAGHPEEGAAFRFTLRKA